VALRPARPDEWPALHALWEASVRSTHDFLAERDRDAYGALVRDHYLPSADLTVAAAAASGAPVGFMGLSRDRIEALYVHPDWLGRGIGSRLVAAAVARIGAPRLEVNLENRGARAFYARLGFRETGRSSTDAAGKPYPLIHLVYAG